MRNRGTLFVVGILALAVSATAASFLYRRYETRRPLQFWGPDAARLITEADKVEAVRLKPVSDSSGDLQVGGQAYRFATRENVTDAPGFTNARDALTLDRSFIWSTPPDECRPNWTHALCFTQGDKRAVILVSFDCPRVMLAGSDRSLDVTPIVAGLKALLAGK